MENHNVIDKAFSEALDYLAHPESFSAEQTKELFANEQFCQVIKEIQLCKTAARQEYARRKPDVNAEWNRFEQKHILPSARRSYYLRMVLPGIAAMLALVFLFAWFRSDSNAIQNDITVFNATEQLQQVTLQTTGGQLVALDAVSQPSKLQQLGAELSYSADTLGLVYHGDNSAAIETHCLSTPRGQDFKLTLSDGTTVWLNAESRIEYPSLFIGKERRVRLWGEAYFQVTSNKECPFIVEAEKIVTRVLGTEFNLSSYQSQEVHVTLIKGSVEVKSNHLGDSFVRIVPGEDAQLLADGTFSVKQVDLDSYIYWKEGFFYFDNTPLIEILKCIGRWYNVTIIFRNPEAMHYRMHYMCDRKGGITQVVDLFNMMRKVRMEFNDNTLFVE